MFFYLYLYLLIFICMAFMMHNKLLKNQPSLAFDSFYEKRRPYTPVFMIADIGDKAVNTDDDDDCDDDDDSDIKIAGEKLSKETDDTMSEANELEKQRQCGNLEKAHALGAALSQKIIDEDGDCVFGQDSSEDENTRTQRRLLLAFAACSTVEEKINSKVLQGVVINIFYNTLKSSLPDFYDDISKSGSFSLYTLCVRRGDNVQQCVGNSFSMLAGKEGDRVMEELGEALYLRFVDVTLQTIKSYNIVQ